MSLPREILPGRFYHLSRRCILQMFLLSPNAVTNATFLYLLAEAAQRFGVDILLPVTMSNHHHTIVFDRHGLLPKFLQRFHQLLARSLNAQLGRWENFWATGAPGVTRLVDTEDVLRAMVYAATNPVTAGLVERAVDWPGVNGYALLLADQPVTLARPTFFRPKGKMPATVTLNLVIPPELGEREVILRELEARIAAREAELAAERIEHGRKVVGVPALLAQRWDQRPTTAAPRRRLNPRIAAKDRDTRIAHLQHLRAFLARYRTARKAWLAGLPATFPPGTYWLRHFAGVQVEDLEVVLIDHAAPAPLATDPALPPLLAPVIG